MRLKSGVRVDGIRPEMLFGVMVAQHVHDLHGAELVLTSVTDGQHRTGSLHYVGAAVDLRTRHLPGGNQGQVAQAIAADLRDRLGPNFDVIVERDHIHMEWQPKRGLNFQS